MHRKKKKKARGGQTGLFAAFYGDTRELLQPQPTVRFHCASGKIEVENCRGILVYNAAQIRLDMGENCILIEGSDLVMDTYQKDRITIHGRLFAVHVCYEKGNC